MSNKQTPEKELVEQLLLTDEGMCQAVATGEAFWLSPENSLRGVPSKDRFICVWEAIRDAQLHKALNTPFTIEGGVCDFCKGGGTVLNFWDNTQDCPVCHNSKLPDKTFTIKQCIEEKMR